MRVNNWKYNIIRACILMMIFLAAGCVGVTHQAYYEGDTGQLTENMIPVKDEKNKFDFLIPAGWTEVPEEKDLPVTLELPRRMSTETGRVTFKKADRGSIIVWCRAMPQTDYHVEQSIYKIAPSSVLVKGPLQIKSSGWNPEFRRYDASLIKKGEKKGFSFFFGTKMQPTMSLYGCDYVVVARSSSLEYADEIESDFIAILRSLKN